MKVPKLRAVRLSWLGREYARMQEKIRAKFRMGERNGGGKKPMKRKEGRARAPKPIIAYDLETTRIREGTPDPLYITWHGEATIGSLKVTDLAHLGEIVVSRLLVPENNGARFVAWNGNNFDVYLIAAALLSNKDYVMRPYLTRSKNLRGLRVTRQLKEKDPKTGKPKNLSWEFLDGIAMTGIIGATLKKFLATFAPSFQKLDGPDFEKEEFRSDNPDHVKYAERDSEGLYHGMVKAQSIVLDTFGIPLYPTIGNTGIRIFQRNIPRDVTVWEPPYTALQHIRNTVMRGGFCFCVRRYRGPVWKYDLNQAYAAAMRDAWLPAGKCIHTRTVNKYANAAIYRIEATNPKNTVPFYYRDAEGDSVFGMKEISDTWITNEEHAQLAREGWKINVIEGYFWDEVFNMKDYVNQLESLRMNAEGGPSGAQGLMVKAIGNNSYGKTVEKLDGLELVLAAECPEGFYRYQEEDDPFQNVWAKLNKPVPREYHQPQLGSFITAHVRMVVRRAALLAGSSWLYADTDCIIASRPVSLNLDPKRYGFWKLEEDGTEYIVVNKKVYAKADGTVKHAKGLNVRHLTTDDFARWYAGAPPMQSQIQKQNFVKVMTGFDMFATRVKVGEKTDRKSEISQSGKRKNTRPGAVNGVT